jgi:valyl-tRNA synthetase
MEELVDIEKEIERLRKEKGRLEGELKRSRGMLGNQKFLANAPAEKVEEEKAKLAKYEQLMQQVEERLSQLSR